MSIFNIKIMKKLEVYLINYLLVGYVSKTIHNKK